MTEITIFTDGSTIPNPGVGGYGFYACTDLITYNGYGSVDNGETTTNNRSELTAILEAIKYFIGELKYKTVLILTDSEYSVNAVNKIISNLVLDTPETMSLDLSPSKFKFGANADILIKIAKTLNELYIDSDLELHLTLKYVRGHKGIHGNETADKNADLGRQCSSGDDHVHHRQVEQADADLDSPITNETIESLEKKKVNPLKGIKGLTQLLSGKKWYFDTNTTLSNDKFIYCTCTYSKDTGKTGKDKPNKNAGKVAYDAGYSVFIADEPIEELEYIKGKFDSVNTSSIFPVLVDLTVVRKKEVWGNIALSKDSFLEADNQMVISKPSEAKVGEIMHPPRLRFQLQNDFSNMVSLYGDIEERLKEGRLADTDNSFTELYDITYSIFSGEGNKTVISPLFLPTTEQLSIIVDYPKHPVDLLIKLNVGTDIPNRNTFLELIKNKDFNAKIYLMLYDIGIGYRYLTIIKTDKGTGIYMCFPSNFKLFKELQKIDLQGVK